MNPFQGKKFQTLKSKWDKKLKEAGFIDIESSRGELKLSHASQFRRKRTLNLKFKNELFYDEAQEFLHSYPFKKIQDQRIWEYFIEGHSVRKIAKTLNTKVCRIHLKIVYLRNQMLDQRKNPEINLRNEEILKDLYAKVYYLTPVGKDLEFDSLVTTLTQEILSA